jgi:hypothetical protein
MAAKSGEVGATNVPVYRVIVIGDCDWLVVIGYYNQ